MQISKESTLVVASMVHLVLDVCGLGGSVLISVPLVQSTLAAISCKKPQCTNSIDTHWLLPTQSWSTLTLKIVSMFSLEP